jgi:hypothetical protein
MQAVTKILKAFDLYGEEIAPISMRGESKHTSACGGLVGMLIYGLILWFLYGRLNKLIQKDDANFF